MRRARRRSVARSPSSARVAIGARDFYRRAPSRGERSRRSCATILARASGDRDRTRSGDGSRSRARKSFGRDCLRIEAWRREGERDAKANARSDDDDRKRERGAGARRKYILCVAKASETKRRRGQKDWGDGRGAAARRARIVAASASTSLTTRGGTACARPATMVRRSRIMSSLPMMLT